jgi:hypothetical protein
MGYKGSDPCYETADDDEPIFVGKGRDPMAALMTLVWASLSEDCQPKDQVREARQHAARMFEYCKERNPGRIGERVTEEAMQRAINFLRRELTAVRRREREYPF